MSEAESESETEFKSDVCPVCGRDRNPLWWRIIKEIALEVKEEEKKRRPLD